MSENVEEFTRRARTWVEANLPRAGEHQVGSMADRVRLHRSLQAQIFDAGFAGIAWPKEYGGQELTIEHVRAFAEVLDGFENPYSTLSVSLGVIGPTILEFGTSGQKATHLPSLLRGDTLWVQFLSEPSGGSDMAGVLTRATRDGDTWVLNGSKVWTTFGQYADRALCLARTDWEVPKHRGLSMFVVPVPAPGLTVVPLTQASGASEFCQEFLEDVPVPADHLIGGENDGWAVASALLVYERNALSGGSLYFNAGRRGIEGPAEDDLVSLAVAAGRSADSATRQVVADMHARSKIAGQLAERVAAGIRRGALAPPAASLLKLYTAQLSTRRATVGVELRGPDVVAWREGDERDRDRAMGWLTRQATAILGGTNEIQRNIISERLLGMPREAAPDRNVPFSQVRTNARTRP